MRTGAPASEKVAPTHPAPGAFVTFTEPPAGPVALGGVTSHGNGHLNMSTQADSASRALGTPPARVEPPAPGDAETSYLPGPPQPFPLRIRVYDYCPEYGPHTDPELQLQEGL